MPGVDPRALAHTYSHPSKDPWEAIQLYELAMTYPDDWGSQRVATAINNDPDTRFNGITRAELRAWIDDDGMPDAAQAVSTARDHGWTATEWTPTTRALARLVGGVYVCGSITTETYVPGWSPADPDTEQVLTTALARVGCDAAHVSRASSAQADEYRPARHASHLGRALAAAGAPVGSKNTASVTTLPEWISDAPHDLKRELANLFVRGRGTEYPNKATRRIKTDRSKPYFTAVGQLIADVTGEAVTATEHGVTVSAAAVRALGLAPSRDEHSGA